MWRKYFNFVKLVPGRVVVQGHGEIDFSRDDIPVELCMKLYESDFMYLEITELGKTELYGLKVEQMGPEQDPQPQKRQKRRYVKKINPDTE